MKRLKGHDIAAGLLLIPWLTFGYPQTPPPASKVVYLSDLTPVGKPINGHGPYEKDRSNGEEAAGDGKPLAMGRVPYAKGLGVHANSDLTFALNKQYASFSAAVGIDDELLTNGCAPAFPGSVVFQVFVDGVKMYDSGTVTVQSSALDVKVDVAGKDTLRLVVGGGGDNLVCDHADWADAKLTAPDSATVAGMDRIFSASAGFSGTQGLNGWSYLDSTGAQLAYRPSSNPSPSGAWQGSEEYLIVSRKGGHPGNAKDSVRRWIAPMAGRIQMTGNAHDGDPACGNGVVVSIKKGTAILWQEAIRNGDLTGANFDLSTNVSQNDTIDFVINRGADGNNLCDTTVFDPTLVLTN